MNTINATDDYILRKTADTRAADIDTVNTTLTTNNQVTETLLLYIEDGGLEITRETLPMC